MTAIPDAREYGRGGRKPNTRPADETPEQRFDRRMRERMALAEDLGSWIELRSILVKAGEHNNLREEVLHLFNERCPPGLIFAPRGS